MDRGGDADEQYPLKIEGMNPDTVRIKPVAVTCPDEHDDGKDRTYCLRKDSCQGNTEHAQSEPEYQYKVQNDIGYGRDYQE